MGSTLYRKNLHHLADYVHESIKEVTKDVSFPFVKMVDKHGGVNFNADKSVVSAERAGGGLVGLKLN